MKEGEHGLRPGDNMGYGKNFVLLVVDDQIGVRKLLNEAFKNDFKETFSASSGFEALEMAKIHNPDVIVMDLKMPGMNGIDAIKALKSTNYKGEIILMTAYGELDTISKAKELGLGYYIAKSFDLKVMRSILEEICQGFENLTA